MQIKSKSKKEKKMLYENLLDWSWGLKQIKLAITEIQITGFPWWRSG